jgi:beta-glucosidase
MLLGAMLAPALHAQSQQYPFQDPKLPVEDRITDLLHRMTLEEKIAALSTNPSVPRLGFKGAGHIEGLHGVALGGPGGWGGKDPVPTTQFPQARGLGQTWDPALLQQAAAVEADEARFLFQSPKYHRGGLVVRAPNADLSRDPRWGRSEESYGEDPFLVGTLTVAYVSGLQQSDSPYWQTASLMKHFLANSNENGRGGSSSNFDERLFHEYYAVPFRMGIEQGGSNAFMTAYNAWNGIPMAAQPVLRDVVMKRWGFDGIICTDAGALTNMVTQHHYYPDMAHAAAGAIHAGINQFLDKFEGPVHDALQQKLITEADIDQNLRGVYRVMFRLGMADPVADVPPASIGLAADAPEPWTLPEHKALARKVTDESIVLLKNALLKNSDHALPLDAHALKRIAVIGPYADKVLLDWYSGTPPYTVSPVDGIKARAGSSVSVVFDDGSDVARAAALAAHSTVAIVVAGNHPTCNAGWDKCPSPSDGKESVDRKSLTLDQEPLLKAVLAANPHTVLALIASFPYAIPWEQQHVPAILLMTHNSQEQGNALADVLFGDYDPAGRISQTWPESMDQLPPMMDYNIRDGRTYMYAEGTPVYSFGYGLSYTHFAYANLRVDKANVAADGSVFVTVDVTNNGPVAGDEVPQLYVSYPASKVARPRLELKGFRRIALRPGETQSVAFMLAAKDLAYWNTATHDFTVEPGPVTVMVGAASSDIRLKKTITVGDGK